MAVEEKELETPETEDDTEREPEVALEEEASSDESPEGQDVEKEEPKASESKVEGKKPYTNEELEELLTSDGEIDDTRLSPEGKLLKKSFQRGFNKKFEQLAEEKRNLKVDSQPKDPKEEYFQRYLQDPVVVVREINAEIQTLTAQGESEKAVILQGIKDEFSARRQERLEQDSSYAEFDRIIAKEIPDIDRKVPQLNTFAEQELGYTPQQLNTMTNPAIVGIDLAIKNIKAIDRLFTAANASKTVQKKVKKSSPAPLERANTGGGASSVEERPQTMAEYMKAERARELAKIKKQHGILEK